MKWLLRHHADPNKIDIDGEMPLHAAAIRGKVNVVRLLLNNSVDRSIRDNDIETALMRVQEIHGRNGEVAKVLQEMEISRLSSLLK